MNVYKLSTDSVQIWQTDDDLVRSASLECVQGADIVLPLRLQSGTILLDRDAVKKKKKKKKREREKKERSFLLQKRLPLRGKKKKKKNVEEE